MGCIRSREAAEGIEVTISPEEKYFELESLLRYNKINISHLYETATQFTTLDAKLTKPNLKKMLVELGLENVGLDTTDSPLRKFYESFVEQGRYNCQSIKLVGILLSQGSAEVKGKLLFEEFDINGSKTLEAREVLSMVSKLCEVALVKLPDFSIGTAVHKGESGIVKYMRTYSQKLRDYKESTIGYLSGGVVSEGAVSLDDFIKKLAKGRMRSIYSAPYLRSLAIDIKAAQFAPVEQLQILTEPSVQKKPEEKKRRKSARGNT